MPNTAANTIDTREVKRFIPYCTSQVCESDTFGNKEMFKHGEAQNSQMTFKFKFSLKYDDGIYDIHFMALLKSIPLGGQFEDKLYYYNLHALNVQTFTLTPL